MIKHVASPVRKNRDLTKRLLYALMSIIIGLLFPTICFSQNWNRVELKNIYSFSLPPTMEIRKDGSLVDKGVKKLHDIAELTYNSNRITLQPKGMNEGLKTSNHLFGRIIIEIDEGAHGDFPIIDEMPKEDIIFAKYIIIESVKEGAIKNGLKILNITPVEIKKIGYKSAFYYSYVRKSSKEENPNVFAQVYRVLDDDKAINITLSYRQSEKSIWHTDFEKLIRSFTFK